MANSSLSVGGIVLQHFEIPSAIDFGGQQRLVVHRLSGGSRIIEVLGPDENEIHFQGIVSGPAAGSRVRAIDSLRKSGAVVPLTWGSFQYPVIVAEFAAEYNNPTWIRYKIRCVVAEQAASLDAPSDRLQAAISSDLATASSAATAVSNNISGLSSLVAATGALTPGTAANAQAYNAAQAAFAAVNDQMAAQGLVLVHPNQNDPTPAAAVSSFQNQLGASQAIAADADVRAYLGRVCLNLKSVGS